MSESLSNNIILLVDCNSFFCSCERLFRPDLRNKPVGVLSNNDGCFVSRSKELKALKVPMGAPFFKYKDVCKKNNVAVFSSNFSLYTNISDRVMKTLAQFSDEIEVYSVDEAFLNIRGFSTSTEFPTLEDYLRHIKTTVEQHTGIPVSIGVGPTKTLAKVANQIAKDNEFYDGVMSLLDPEIQDQALESFELDDIWGIGRALAPRLRLLGMKSAKDFRDYPNEKQMLKLFSVVEIYRKRELQGVQKFKLENTSRNKKMILCSRSFSAAVKDLSELRASVAHHVSSATEKLRKQKSLCRTVRVFIRTNRFKESEQHYGSDEYILDMATADTRKIMDAAMKVLDKIYVKGFEYKKAGVVLGGIVDAKTQLSLFEKMDSTKSESLMKSIDFINAKSGSETIKFAVTSNKKKSWRMAQNLKSPKYVSGWAELPKIK